MRPAVMTMLLAICLALAVAGCERADTIVTMANFDRAYIPAFILTGAADPDGRSVMAVKQLKQQWFVFQSQQPVIAGGRAGERIEDLILEADGLVSARRNREAHEALDEIRMILMRQRMAVRVDYFPDRLTAFHVVMEMMLRSAGDPEVVNEFLPEARTRWSVVKAAKFKPEKYRFPKAMAGELDKNIAEVDKALAALERAAARSDRPAMKRKAATLKERFMNEYRMFGNFEGASL